MIRKPLLMIVQSLKAPHKRIAQEAVAEVMGKLHGLDCLDPEDTARISPTINDAARCYYSVHWWPLFREAIRKRYRMQAAIVLATILFILLSWNILPKPRTANMTVDNISSVVILAEVLVAAGAVFYFLIPYRCRTAFLMTGAGAALLVVAKFPTFQRWSVHVLPARAELAPPFTLLVWLLALVCILITVRRSVIFFGKVIASGLESGYGQPAEQCAELVLRFLDVSSTITDLLGHMQSQIVGDKDVLWLGESKLPSYYARQRIKRQLDMLAFLVRKPWQRAMRSRNGSAGLWIAGHAPRIEFFIRFQQSKNILAGNNLTELRDSMASALVKAADADWHLIGSEPEYSSAVLVSRWKMMIRRSIATTLPILGAVAAVRLLRAPYVQVVAFTCISFAGVQLLGFIDPDSPTARLDVAGRLASTLKRGNG